MQVYTTIKTLKKAWNCLKELGMEGLLSGGEVKIDIDTLLGLLLNEGKLNEFCQIITKSDVDFEEKELEDVMKVINDFFTGIGSALQGLALAGIATHPTA